MATVSRTWVFAADTEGLADVGDSASIPVNWDAVPQMLEFGSITSGVSQSERARGPVTAGKDWTVLFPGLPAGATVSDIQCTAWQYQQFAVASITAWRMRIRVVDSAGASVHSAGDLIDITDAAPATDGAKQTGTAPGTSRAVDAAKQDASTIVALELQFSFTGTATSVDIDIDGVAITVTYATAAAGRRVLPPFMLRVPGGQRMRRVPAALVQPASTLVTIDLTGSGLTRTRALGAPQVNPGLVPASLVHTRALGATQSVYLLEPASLTRTRALGGPQVNVTLKPASLVRTRALGTLTVSAATFLLPSSLTRTRALGGPQVNPSVPLTAIVRTRALGAPLVNPKLAVASLTRTRALGTPNVIQLVKPASLTRTRTLGSLTVSPTIPLASLTRTRTLGAPGIPAPPVISDDLGHGLLPLLP